MYHKKSLGQHFLRNQALLEKIVAAAKLAPVDSVLEVGPGEGALTEILLQRAGKVIAVEKDSRLIPSLQKRFASEIASEKLNLVYGDILTFNVKDKGLRIKDWKIVANLPYYITGQFLRKFLQSEHQPSSMTLLLQREVAKRIVAADGKESLLSISVKAYGTPRYIATVKAGAFSPPPKVDSAIIVIEKISKNFFAAFSCHSCEACPRPRSGSRNPEEKNKILDSRVRGNDREERFFALLKQGFAHPRKLLSSNLGVTPEQLAECSIAPNARAENLSLENWKCLMLKHS